MEIKTETHTPVARILVHPPHGIPLKMMEGFLSRCRSSAGNLNTTLGRGEFDAVRVFGHRLRGSGGTYGIARLSEIGSMIETAAAEQDLVQLKSLVVALDSYLSLLEVVT